MNRILLFLTCALCGLFVSNGQDERQPNVIGTGVPYLLISPDARGGSLGDQGVATTADENSIFWNMSKTAFLEKKSGLSISYAPWLSQLVNDVYITTLAGHYKLNNQSAVALNVKYFSLGSVEFRESLDDQPISFSPNEFTIDAGYALKLSRKLSAGIVLKYINSNLASGTTSQSGQLFQPAQTIATDISLFYQGSKFDLSGKDAYMTYGMNISNIGGKVRYQVGDQGSFLPANMRLGAGVHVDLDKFNKFSFSLETIKLLAPTAQPGDQDANDDIRNLSSIQGIFRSFGDSPEGESELDEFAFSVGAEYMYNNVLAIRAGYFHENKYKGNRRYATIGTGLKLEQGSLDFSYLTAVSSITQHPLEGTLRFTLNLNLDAFSSPEPEAPEKNDSSKENKEDQ